MRTHANPHASADFGTLLSVNIGRGRRSPSDRRSAKQALPTRRLDKRHLFSRCQRISLKLRRMRAHGRLTNPEKVRHHARVPYRIVSIIRLGAPVRERCMRRDRARCVLHRRQETSCQARTWQEGRVRAARRRRDVTRYLAESVCEWRLI